MKITDERSRSWRAYEIEMTRVTLTSPDLRGTFPSTSLVVPRNLFPYVTKIFHPKLLKFMGKAIPWRVLNRLIELTGTMHANARDIYDTKKRLLELGDSATVKQVGDGKDIISLLSTSTVFYNCRPHSRLLKYKQMQRHRRKVD